MKNEEWRRLRLSERRVKLAWTFPNRVSSESHENLFSDGRVAFEVDKINVSRLDRRSMKNECHCVAEIVQIYPNPTKHFFFLKQRILRILRIYAIGQGDGRYAQNYQKINSKNYKNCCWTYLLIIFLFNFFIILRPIGRPQTAWLNRHPIGRPHTACLSRLIGHKKFV